MLGDNVIWRRKGGVYGPRIRGCKACAMERALARVRRQAQAVPPVVAMSGARSVCFRVSGLSQIIDWDSPEAAAQAMATVPCGPECTGSHGVMVCDAGRLRVVLAAQPAPTLAEQLAQLYPRTPGEEPRFWPAPSALNRPLRHPQPSRPLLPDPTPGNPVPAALDGNDSDAITRRPDLCVHGHTLGASNVYLRPDGRGRQCRACQRDVDSRPRRMRRHAELQRQRRQRRKVERECDYRLRRGSPPWVNAGKTACVHGHAFDGENTIIRAGAYGRPRRECRQCRNESCRRHRHRRSNREPVRQDR
jgi:hypothetical protein